MSEIKMLMSDNFLKQWEIVKMDSTGKHGIVVAEDISSGPFSTTFTIKTLNISKWWPIKKIQLWAIKKAFKQDNNGNI